jgi:hypothetical protein
MSIGTRNGKGQRRRRMPMPFNWIWNGYTDNIFLTRAITSFGVSESFDISAAEDIFTA